MKRPRRSNAPRELDRKKIRSMYKKGYCASAIARHFDCQLHAVMHHISDLVIPSLNHRRKNSKLNEKQVNQIRNLYIRKYLSAEAIALKFKISASCVLNVVHGIYYRWVPGEVMSKDGTIYEIPKEFGTTEPLNKKGRKKSGPNKFTVRRVPSGTLIPLAKKYGVATCTISRWIRNGKLSPKREIKRRKKV